MAQESAPKPQIKLSEFRRIKREFGLNPTEAMREGEFEGQRTTYAALLAEPTRPSVEGELVCPVPGWLRTAHKKDGRAGTLRFFTGLSMMHPEIDDPIAQAQDQKVQRIEQRHQWIAEKDQKKN